MPISSDFVLTSRYPNAIIPEKSLPDFALEEFQTHPNEIAFIYTPTGEEYTYGDICHLVKELSAGLQYKYNLKKGDVVATCLSNCPEFLITMLAVQRLGGILSTSNPAYTVEELEHHYRTANPQFILTEEELLPSVLTVASKLQGFRKVILAHGHSQHVLVDNIQNLLTIGKTAPAPVLPVLDVKNDVACILFSSGTTGLPKGVMLTHRNLVSDLCQTTDCRQPPGSRKEMPMPLRGDVAYIPFPYFHVGGIHMGLMWPLIAGATIVCMPRYHSHEFLSNIQKYRITMMILPPPVLVFLAKSPLVNEFDLSSIRLIVCGAAPVSKETSVEVLDRLKNLQYIVQLYGMTELSPLTHLGPMNKNAREKSGSIGTLLSSTSGRIVSMETGKNCGPREVGELWVKGPQVMKGYLNRPEATADMLTSDGWLKTGDIGYFDEDEYFYIADRLKELIKVKAYQVAPAELEAVILTHPAVADVIVIGIPDTYAGELPRAYVVLKKGQKATAQHIQDHVKEHVVSYKRLAGGVVFVDEVPKTATGKLLRRELRKKVQAELAAQKSKL